MTTFISNYEMLAKLISQCSKWVKEDGYLFIADFQYPVMPLDNWWAEMYTTYDGEGKEPKAFEIFKFIIQTAPDHPYDIFQIPYELVFKAGIEAGFKICEN